MTASDLSLERVFGDGVTDGKILDDEFDKGLPHNM